MSGTAPVRLIAVPLAAPIRVVAAGPEVKSAVEAGHHDTAHQCGLGVARPRPLPVAGGTTSWGAGRPARPAQDAGCGAVLRARTRTQRAAPMVQPQFRAAHGVPGRLLVAHQDEQDRGARCAAGCSRAAAPTRPAPGRCARSPEPAALGMRSQVKIAHPVGELCHLPSSGFVPTSLEPPDPGDAAPRRTDRGRLGSDHDTPASGLVRRRCVPRCSAAARGCRLVDHLGPRWWPRQCDRGPSAALCCPPDSAPDS